jgi:type II secretory pathway component PulF
MWNWKRLRFQQLVDISQQLSHLLGNGVGLVESLEVLQEQAFGFERIGQVKDAIEQGKSLSTALEGCQFPELFISFIRIAEEHGDYAYGFSCCYQYYHDQLRFRQEMMQACIYPLTVLGCVFFAMFLMITVIFPRFAGLYASLGVSLPPLTRVIFTVSQQINQLLYLSVFLLVLYLVLRLLDQYQWISLDKWFHRLPFFRFFYQYRYTHYFSIQLGSLLQAGVPMLRALELMEQMSPWRLLTEQIQSVKQALVVGKSLQTAINLPPGIFLMTLSKMIAVGEKTGKLDQALLQLAQTTEMAMKKWTQRLFKGLEPMLIFCLGVMILLMVVALFLPMMQLIQVV